MDNAVVQEFDVTDPHAIAAAHSAIEGSSIPARRGGWPTLQVAYEGEWLDVYRDLAAYAHWRAARCAMSWSEEQAFLQAPTSRPDWLREAVVQFLSKLQATEMALARA